MMTMIMVVVFVDHRLCEFIHGAHASVKMWK